MIVLAIYYTAFLPARWCNLKPDRGSWQNNTIFDKKHWKLLWNLWRHFKIYLYTTMKLSYTLRKWPGKFSKWSWIYRIPEQKTICYLGISYVKSLLILWILSAAQYMRCLIISQLRSANKSLYNIVLSMYYHAYSYTIIQVNMAFLWKNEEMLWLMSWKRKNYKCYIAAI